MDGIQILPVEGIPEILAGDDLPAIMTEAVKDAVSPGDVVVVTHKIVSKAEDRVVDLREIKPSAFASSHARRYDKDPRRIEVVLRESRRIVRMDRGIIISETHHGFVCANAGVDVSNVPGEDKACLLPVDPDASAAGLYEGFLSRFGFGPAVIVSDSFGRAWRDGITNVAIGLAGMYPFADYRGEEDPHGNPLAASVLAVADELAGAAELVMGKTATIPAALVRGYPYSAEPGTARELLMPTERDLFR